MRPFLYRFSPGQFSCFALVRLRVQSRAWVQFGGSVFEFVLGSTSVGERIKLMPVHNESLYVRQRISSEWSLSLSVHVQVCFDISSPCCVTSDFGPKCSMAPEAKRRRQQTRIAAPNSYEAISRILEADGVDPLLGRHTTVLSTCAGLDVPARCLRDLGLRVTNLAYDSDPVFRKLLESVNSGSGRVCTGKAGDILTLDNMGLDKSIEIVVGGPPCPPWSKAGLGDWDKELEP